MRELCHAVDRALALPAPATVRDETTYLRILRDRVRLVRSAIRRLLAEREAEDRDVMLAAASLRDEAAQLGDDQYDHVPEPS
ncbi:MAG: hypothetical protein WA895_11705 [Streptosporangiaceae bacterium]